MERRRFLQQSAMAGITVLLGTRVLANGTNWFDPKSHSTTGTSQHSLPSFAQPTGYQPVSASYTLQGRPIKIHAFSTGEGSVKRNFLAKKGPGPLSKLNILLGGQYADYMPIWVWVIEHPEGLIVIDTGEIPEAMDSDQHLAGESALNRYISRHTMRFRIADTEVLDRQFERLGLQLDRVQLVILTHLHLDHTDGLRFFPKTEVVVGEVEWKHPYSPSSSTWPKGFRPRTLTYLPDQLPIFGAAMPLTQAGDLLYVPTPGHTRGHSSVLLRADEGDIFFAGDVTYTQQQLLLRQLPGVHQDYGLARNTYQKILDYAQQRPFLYLPSHDPEAGLRLVQKQFLVEH
jgi:N-acyl homoserine lactone hydrolase